MSSLNSISLISSVAGAIGVLVWRVRETHRPVSAKKILIPPIGMATGFGMFMVPAFQIPWTWAAAALLVGTFGLAYPLLRMSHLVREGEAVMMKRSNAFFAILIVLAGIRIAARGYLDTVLSTQQTAALFFVLAFGMILRWRTKLFLEYRTLVMGSRPPR